ncbi:MAG TPA: DNA polymerase III subunit delta [Drouetiella sp.]
MPVTIIAGDEEFELSRRVQELREQLVDPNWASVNFLRLDNPPLQEIIDASGTLPFGPGNKVVLIDRCELFTKKRSKGGDDTAKADTDAKGKDKMLDDLEKTLATVAPNTYVIFACPFNLDQTLKTTKAVQKHAEIERFEKQKFYVGSPNAVLNTWCRKEAKRHNATIEDQAVTYLLDGTEANLRQISAEIEKAAIHTLPGNHITYQTVVQLSPYHSHVFALADFWLAGKGRDALASAEELLTRQSAMPIIATMQTMISKWILMKSLCEKFNHDLPTPPGVVRRELPMNELVRRVAGEMKQKEFMIEKDLKRISKIPLERLIEKRLDLTRLEDSIKTGMIPESHALQVFLAG